MEHVRRALDIAAWVGLVLVAVTVPSMAWAAPSSHTLDDAPPPPTNAAKLYGQAFELMRFSENEGSNRLGFTREEWDRLNNVYGPEALTPEVRELVRRAQPALDLVRQAATLPKADFGLDRSQGHELLLPHLSQMRSLSRVMQSEALQHIVDGDVGAAVEIMETQSGMSSHLCGDSVLISSLVSRSLAQLNDGLIENCLDRGTLDGESAARLAAALGRLDSADPFQISHALGGEVQLFATSVGAIIERGSGEEFAEPAQSLGGDLASLSELDPGVLHDQLAATRSLYDEVRKAFANPSSDAARATLASIATRIASGEGGDIARSFTSGFDRIYEMKLEGDRLIQERRAMLIAIAEGRLDPQSVANAAMWYRLAARAAVSIPEDEQATLEAFRVTFGAVDETVRAETSRLIERHCKAVIEPLLAGSRCGKCAFTDASGRPALTVLGLPDYAPGLRAAARLLQVAQVLGPSSPSPDAATAERPTAASTPAPVPPRATPPVADPNSLPPDPIAQGWLALIRLVSHLAGDPKVAHAVLAQSIFAEGLAVATWQSSRWTPSEPWRERLDQTLGSVERGDPVGHRRGLVADRAILARTFLYPANPGDPPDPKRAAILALDGATVISIGLLLQHNPGEPAPLTCGASPDDVLFVLRDMRDLYDPAGCRELSEQQATMWRSPLLSGVLELRPGAPPLGIDPVPVVVDVALLAPEAPTLLAAWEKLFARRAPGP